MGDCLVHCTHSSKCVLDCTKTFPMEFPPENVLGAIGLLLLSGLFSGLTLGLMSLDVRQLEIAIAGGDSLERLQAERILPLRRRGNLLLCTLLLGALHSNAHSLRLTPSVELPLTYARMRAASLPRTPHTIASNAPAGCMSNDNAHSGTHFPAVQMHNSSAGNTLVNAGIAILTASCTGGAVGGALSQFKKNMDDAVDRAVAARRPFFCRTVVPTP